MKVVLLSTSFPLVPGSTSGIFVARLVDKLAELVDVVVITPADTTVTGHLQRGNTLIVPCHYAPGRWQLLAHRPGGLPVTLKNHPVLWLFVPVLLLSLSWNCLREARSSDVLHANWTICGCIAGIIGLLTRKPVITSLRGEDITRAAKKGIDYILLRLCFALSKQVVCVSSDMRSLLVRKFPGYEDKLITIENGVEDVFLKVATPRSYKNDNNSGVRFITIGSLIPRKGIDQIVIAFSRINFASRASLEIVGVGPEETRLRKLANDLKVSDHVHFSGSVAPETVPGKLHKADVFVIASHSEGRPNVLVEAMAAGLPVIASDISGVRELVEHNRTGMLFADGDDDQLTQYMQLLASDGNLRERLGRAGHEYLIKQGSTWEDCALRYVQVYRQFTGIN